MQSFVPRDTFALRIQRQLCNPKWARKVSGLSRNGPLLTMAEMSAAFTVRLFTFPTMAQC